MVDLLHRTGVTVVNKKEVLPEWKVSGIFSSHMVLQRNCPITVWGWSCHIGEESFTPSEMSISSRYGMDRFQDILVGDVWVIGGQSNAELSLEPCLKYTLEIAEDLDEKIPVRLFLQTQAAAYDCLEHYFTPARDIIRPEWCWKRADAEASREFSALGYYFARMVSEKAGIPIGVVMMCASAACLRELMPEELAKSLNSPIGVNVPVSAYYHTLIAPLVGLKFKGQIFFQGESEAIPETKEMALSYDKNLAAFVADERQRFDVDFSFYNVQLSSYTALGAEWFTYLYWVRSRQYDALYQIPKSYLIVSRDQGSLPEDEDPIHSPHKYDTAQRVANLALATEYGIGNPEHVNSPFPINAVRIGEKVCVKFRYLNGGLRTSNEKRVTGFSFMNAKEEEIPAMAEIIAPDTVEVVIPDDVDVSEIHFAMYNIATMEEANLCGGNGLPAPTFAMKID